MGSEGGTDREQPVHTVEVSSFYMGKYEVTNREYCEFLNSQGNQVEDKRTWIRILDDHYCGIVEEGEGKFQVKPGYENRPVVYVRWYGALAYCNWLSEEEGLTPCYGPKDDRGEDPAVWRTYNGYRLPTEAEWEFACRAGSETAYYWGDFMVGDYCCYRDNSNGEKGRNHEDVGLRLPNKFGLCGMAGNVSEWCSDWYGEYSSESFLDPAGPSEGTNRVARGGSWCYQSELCHSSYRNYGLMRTCYSVIGFRLVKNS